MKNFPMIFKTAIHLQNIILIYKTKFLLVLSLLIICSCKEIKSDTHKNENKEITEKVIVHSNISKLKEKATHQDKKDWFHNAKIGIFIHWNTSSVKHVYDKTKHPNFDPNSPWKIDGFTPPESTDKEEYSTTRGVDISWGRIGPRRGKFKKFDDITPSKDIFAVSPYAQYNLLYKKFKPSKLNPEKWAKLFKKAGANYVVQIAKHHDRFAMFDANQSLIMDDNGYPKVNKNGDAIIAKDEIKNTGWKITHPDSYGKDIVKLCSDAFRKEGLQLGFYYSNPDWTHPNYQVSKKEELNLADKAHSQWKYIDYMKSQVSQLLTDYGDVLTLWFDGIGGHHTVWGSDETYDELRSINPSTLFNNRFFFDLDYVTKAGNQEDYYTPERKLGAFDNEKKWETCDILVDYHTWSFMKDNPALPSKKVIRDLVNVVDNGGNYLLNVGPDEYGNIRPEDEAVLLDIGQWLAVNGESIYNTDAGPYLSNTVVSSSHSKNAIYLHILDKAGEEINIPEVSYNTLKKIETLTGESVVFKHSNSKYMIMVPKEEQKGITTLKMIFKNKFPEITPKKELIKTN